MFRQLNLLSTATPAIGAWLVPIDQLKSSLRKLDMEGTLRVCAVMGCIMTEALEVMRPIGLTSESGFTVGIGFIYRVFICVCATEEEHPHPDPQQVQPGDEARPLPAREPVLHAVQHPAPLPAAGRLRCHRGGHHGEGQTGFTGSRLGASWSLWSYWSLSRTTVFRPW